MEGEGDEINMLCRFKWKQSNLGKEVKISRLYHCKHVLTPQDFFLGGPGEPLGIFIKMRELQRRSCCWCASRRMVKGKWHIFMSQSPPSRPFGWTFNLLHSLFSIVICQPFQNCYLMVCTFKVRFMYTFSISFSFLEWHSWNINLLVFSALLFDGCCGCISYMYLNLFQ